MKTINVLRHVKIDGKWMLLPVAKKDGKLDWAHLVYKGTLIPLTEGTFHLDWREGKKRFRPAAGDTVREAKVGLATQLQVVDLRDQGVEMADAPEIVNRKAKRGAENAARNYDQQTDVRERINEVQRLLEELKSKLRNRQVCG